MVKGMCSQAFMARTYFSTKVKLRMFSLPRSLLKVKHPGKEIVPRIITDTALKAWSFLS